jgi:hypothetical protein
MLRPLFLLALCSLLSACSDQKSENAKPSAAVANPAPSMESRPLRRPATAPTAGFQDNGLIGGGTPVDESLPHPPPVATSGDADPFKALPASVDKTPIRTDGIGLSPGAASPGHP